MSDPRFHAVGDPADVPEGYVMPYYLADHKRRISVARSGGRLHAFDDLSPTDGAPLSSGRLTGTIIMSPCDGAEFDITTGQPVDSRGTAPLATYDVRENDGRIEVLLD